MSSRDLCKLPSFNGVIQEVPDISVDYFENLNATTYFLSHCHADHTYGLTTEQFQYHIKQDKNYLYCSALTKCILEKTHFKSISERILVLSVGQSYMITVPSKVNPENEAQLCVSLVPTGHCPGAVMFLFETNRIDSPVLYTGDFRLCKTDVAKLAQLHENHGIPRPIYKVYLDATFVDDRHKKFPLRKESIEAVCCFIDFYSNGMANNVMFCIEKPARFGSETLLIEIAKRFDTKIHVDEAAHWIYMQIPEISSYVTNNPESTRIHACQRRFEINNEKACFLQCRNRWFKSKVIRPSCLWFDSTQYDGTLQSIVEEETNEVRTRICYASHCSKEELEYFVMHLKPRKMEPIAVPRNATKQQVIDWFLGNTRHYKDHVELGIEESEISTNNKPQSASKTAVLGCNEVRIPELVFRSEEMQMDACLIESSSFTEIQNLVSRDLELVSDENKGLKDELAYEIKQLQFPTYSSSFSADLTRETQCAIEAERGAVEMNSTKMSTAVLTHSFAHSEKPQFDKKPFPKRSRKLKPLGNDALVTIESLISEPEVKVARNPENEGRLMDMRKK